MSENKSRTTGKVPPSVPRPTKGIIPPPPPPPPSKPNPQKPAK